MLIRDRELKCTHCTGLPVDWELYRDSRRVVKIRLRKAEHEYINKEMEGCQMYQKTKNLYGCTKGCCSFIEGNEPLHC